MSSPDLKTDTSSESITGEFTDELEGGHVIENYEEYKQFIEANEIPDYFVFYEQIAPLGDFVDLIILTDYRYSYAHCLYTLKDANGYLLSLYVENLTTDDYKPYESDQTPNILAVSSTDDLRQYPNETSGSMSLNGLEYSYIKGKLSSIRWVYNGVEFTLCSDSVRGMLDDYPIGSKTFTSKMLSASQSAAAVQSFNQQVLDQHVTE